MHILKARKVGVILSLIAFSVVLINSINLLSIVNDFSSFAFFFTGSFIAIICSSLLFIVFRVNGYLELTM